jgi:hypothetical protein
MRLRPFFLLVGLLACIAPAAAQSPRILTFQTIDPSTTSLPPQVFVQDDRAPAQSDGRGTVIAGFRRLRTDDQPAAELFNGDGTSLLFTLEKWRAATGTVDLAGDDTETKVNATFKRLIAFGRYSLFLRAGVEEGMRYSPLDGKGELNSFTADQEGAATLSAYTRRPLTAGAIVVVVYHSDAKDHGISPGIFGYNAHQQLVVRVP